MNYDCWFAPTSNSYTFKCEKCGKTNFITSDLKAIKLEEVTLQHIKEGFEMTTSVNWREGEIDRMCKEIARDLGIDELREIVAEKLRDIEKKRNRK